MIINYIRSLFGWGLMPKAKDFPMIYVHTFKSGEKLYTYRPEDYTNIAYRHYEQLSELQRYIQSFGLTPFEWKAGLEQVRKECKEALESKDKTDALLNVIKFADHFEKKAEQQKSNLEALNEMTFCMFYVLEDEPPATWSPAHNEKKLKLLKENPDVRAFFFSMLQSFSMSYAHTSANDTAALLKEIEDMKAAMKVPTKSKPKATPNQ